jgi:fumarate hydratase subunit alpha
MRTILPSQITEAVKKAVIDINYFLPHDVMNAVKEAAETEEDKKSKTILYKINENAKISKKGEYPLCQDTGLPVVFLEMGNEVKVEGDIYEAINRGIEAGYKEGFLRKSVADPITRKNTNTNTPAIIHTVIKKGPLVTLSIMAKGAGSENKSAVKMLVPSDGLAGIKAFVIETVKKAGASACPPYIIGVGIGGNLETAPLLSKKALMRDLKESNKDKDVKALEKELLEELNKLKIGPLGFGGNTTALAVLIEKQACHIASLPCAVTIQCHSARHKTINI